MSAEQQVLDLYRDILENGRTNSNRTGTDSIRVFGRQMRFDLSTAFPLLTTKKINFKNIVTELLWFIKGDTNISYLKEHGCNIWDQWSLNIKAIDSDRAFEIARDLITRDSLPYDAAELTVHDRNVILLNYGIGSYECTDIPLFLEEKRVLTETERLHRYRKVRDVTMEEIAAESEAYITNLTQRELWTGGRAKAYLESKLQLETDMHRLGIPYEVTQINPRQQNVKPHQDGSLGPVYGAQWVRWKVGEHKYINQLEECIHLLKTKPFSRRIIVSAWNPADLPDESVSPQENVLDGKMALATCHTLFQFFADKATVQERVRWLAKNDEESFKLYKSLMADGKAGNDLAIREAVDLLNEKAPELRLSCQLYQRSCDSFLGLPYNIASYALLAEMVAQVTNMIPGEFVWSGGDVHLYENHIDQVKEQLTREPYPLPTLRLNRDITDINAFTHDDIVLENYQSHTFIKAPIAV